MSSPTVLRSSRTSPRSHSRTGSLPASVRKNTTSRIGRSRSQSVVLVAVWRHRSSVPSLVHSVNVAFGYWWMDGRNRHDPRRDSQGAYCDSLPRLSIPSASCSLATISAGRCFARRLIVESLLALRAVDLRIDWIRISKAGQQALRSTFSPAVRVPPAPRPTSVTTCSRHLRRRLDPATAAAPAAATSAAHGAGSGTATAPCTEKLPRLLS